MLQGKKELGNKWGAHWKLNGHTLRTTKTHKIQNTHTHTHTPLPLLKSQTKLGPSSACWLTSLDANNFYAYLCCLPLLAQAKGKAMN